jgi:tight adherence protein C
MDNPILIALLFTIAVALFLYVLFVPRTGKSYTQGDYSDNGNTLLKGASVIGNEVYSMLPSSLIRVKTRTGSTRVEKLIQMSANPWNIKAADFTFFQIIFAVLFAIGGTGVGLLLTYGADFFLPFWVFTLGGALLGWIYPSNTYKSAAAKRDLEFKRQLPEALDLMIISLSGGSTFVTAMRESIPNMQPGVLRDEFRKILKSVDAGATLNQALQNFADRAPNDAITTFIKAVQEATELNVPLIDTLQSRAEASRREFFTLIQQKTATLESKMMGILAPTLIPALLICVLAPAAFSLMASL